MKPFVMRENDPKLDKRARFGWWFETSPGNISSRVVFTSWVFWNQILGAPIVRKKGSSGTNDLAVIGVTRRIPEKNAVFHTGLNHAVRQKWIWDLILNETFWGCISCGCLWFEKIYRVWFIAICGECIWRSQILNVLYIFTCIYHTKDLLDTRDFVIL